MYLPEGFWDVGKTLVVRLTMTKAGFPTLVVQSAPRKVRAGILPSDGVTLLGTPGLGETVVVNTGTSRSGAPPSPPSISGSMTAASASSEKTAKVK